MLLIYIIICLCTRNPRSLLKRNYIEEKIESVPDSSLNDNEESIDVEQHLEFLENLENKDIIKLRKVLTETDKIYEFLDDLNYEN